jgi:hypothetical protein
VDGKEVVYDAGAVITSSEKLSLINIFFWSQQGFKINRNFI